MSGVTGFISTTGTTFYTQHTKFNITEEFGHAADKSQSDSNKKWTAAASVNPQDFMDTIIHQPCNWEDLEHCHMTHEFWRKFGTYLGQHTKNKMTVKFPRVKKAASKKGVMSSKVARTATSNKDVSKICLINESDILLKTFGPAEINQDEIKELVHQDEFINSQLLFRNNYYASNNMHFQHNYYASNNTNT